MTLRGSHLGNRTKRNLVLFKYRYGALAAATSLHGLLLTEINKDKMLHVSREFRHMEKSLFVASGTRGPDDAT